jgi:regulator of protease activity HflC (stomatin/prohibitin superfamily)
MEVTADLIVIGLIALLAIVLVFTAVRIVPEYKRLVVFRLGRLIGERGPGFVLLIPFVDRGVRVDLRERFFDVQPQTTITEDNAHLSIDFLVYSKVVDAVPSVLNVVDHDGASRGIAITTLRAVVGSMQLDDVLAKREDINTQLREKLDEVTNRWGIKVTAVEIREIKPPAEVEAAMTRQMSSERDRRATVIRAQGEREAIIRVAEGDRQAAILRAEGAAKALETIFEAARKVDSKTMALQYLEMLKVVGAADSTKLLLPAELTSLLRPFLHHAAEAAQE